ncbi:MAG TPA: cupredoxin domain-containing protein [Acidimicrobiales bacterium]|nr:cupredoxin domain-containing protein [Acidimicrobiales bacterium]
MSKRRSMLSISMVVAAIVLIPASGASAGGGGGCHQATEGAGDTVVMSSFCFTPTVLRVEPGTEVTWTNDDQSEHVVVGTGWGLDTTLQRGDRASRRFDDEGTYPYACYLHPSMNGVVVVGETMAASSATEDLAVLDGAQPASSSRSTESAALGAGVAALAGLVIGAAGSRRWARRRA